MSSSRIRLTFDFDFDFDAIQNPPTSSSLFEHQHHQDRLTSTPARAFKPTIDDHARDAKHHKCPQRPRPRPSSRASGA